MSRNRLSGDRRARGRGVLAAVFCGVLLGLAGNAQAVDRYWVGSTSTPSSSMGEPGVLPSPDSGNGNLLVAQSAVLSQADTIQSLSFYVTTAAGTLRLGIYDATGPSGGPGAKQAETAEITPTVGWNTANVVTPVALPAGTYWLAYFASDNALAFLKTDDASSSGRYYFLAYGPLPTTFSTAPSTTASHWSFYATGTGAGPSLIRWHNSANWSATSGGAGGASVPGSADIARFDGGGLNNCTINANNVDVGGIDIAAGYTGTITQAAVVTIQVRTSHYAQAGGTFTGADGTITLLGNFTLSGGTFNAPSGTIKTDGNWTVSGGVFNPNGGTVQFRYASAYAVPLIAITGSHALHHVTFNSEQTSDNVAWTVANGTTLTVNGTLSLIQTLTSNFTFYMLGPGTIAAKGNIITNNTYYPDSGAPLTILINGTGEQTWTGSAVASNGWVTVPTIHINKPSGTLHLVGTIRTLNKWTYTAGTIDAGTSTVVFEGIGGSSSIITGTHTLSNVRFHSDNSCCHAAYSIAAGTTLTAAGTLTLAQTSTTNMRTNGPGTLVAQGDVVTNYVSDPSSDNVAITLAGSNNQLLNIATLPQGTLTINKSGGVVTLARNLAVNVAGQDLTLTAGTLDLAGYTLTVNDVLTNNGTLIAAGAGTPITAGTLTSTSATSLVRYTGNGADGAVTIKPGTYGSLTVDNAGTTFTLGGAATLLANLSITAGSTLDVSASNYALTVPGNWANAGTFTPRSGTVTLNGTNQAIVGTTTFYRLSKVVTASDTLTFPASLTTTVQNDLTLQGAAQNNPLYLRSSVPGTMAPLTLQAGGTQTILHVDVKDSNASGGVQLIAYDSVNAGNNLNWLFQPLDLSAGLMGFWKLDETSGTSAADASANNNTGTLANGPVWTAGGKVGGALSFDGVDDTVNAGSAAAVDNAGAVTVTAWIFPDTVGENNNGRIAQKAGAAPSSTGWRFYTNVTNTLTWTVSYSTGNLSRLTSNNSITLGAWNHVAVTWDGSTTAANARLYVNGVETSYQTTTNGSGTRVDDAANDLLLGNDSTAARSFDGLLDEVRVYNRVLAPTEVAKLASTAGTGVLTLKDPVTPFSATLTNSPNVRIELSALEAAAQSYILSNTSGSFTGTTVTLPNPPPSPYIAGTNWPLSPGDGEKFVYARISLGSSTYDISDTITLDATAPAAPTGLVLTANSDNTGFTATVTAPSSSDVSSLVWRYTAQAGNVAASYPASSTAGTALGTGLTSNVTPGSAQSITVTSMTQLQTYSVAVWAKDAAGNVSSSPAQAYLYLAPPTPRLVVTAPSSAVAAPAGDALTLTLTAKDANGSVITTYAGPYSLTWTPTGGSASTLVSSSSSGWSSGVTTTSVTIGGANAGTGTFTATDNSDNALTNGTLSFTFYPASFTVTPGSTTPAAGSPFTLTATAKDSAGTTVSRYSGTVALSVNYITPSSGTKALSVSSATCSAGVCSVASMHYPDAGAITITAKDTTYVSGITIQGTSATVTMKPANFSLTSRPLPASLTKVYVNQPFEMIVKALAADGQITPNYRGTVTLSSTGASIGTATHTFVPGDLASYTFTDLRASSAGVAAVTATDGTVTSAPVNVSVRAAKLIFNPATGPPGRIYSGVYIKDLGTNTIVSEDQSTQISITLQSPTKGAAATLVGAANPARVSSGIVPLTIEKLDEGDVTLTGSVQGFSLPVESATLKWATGATSSSTTTFQVLQFEQAPSTSTTYTYPTTTYTYPTSTYTTTSPTTTYFAPTTSFTPTTSGFTTSTTGFTPTTSYSAPTSGTFTYTSPTGVTSTQTATSGGSRYDSAVSLGYTLVAPTFSSSGPSSFGSFSTFSPTFSYAPGTSSGSSGPSGGFFGAAPTGFTGSFSGKSFSGPDGGSFSPASFTAPTGSYGGFYGALAGPSSGSSSSGFSPSGSMSAPAGAMFFGPSSGSGPMGSFSMGHDGAAAPSFMGMDGAAMMGPAGSFSPMGMTGAAGGMGYGPAPAGMKAKMEGMAQAMRDSGQLSATQFNAVMQGIQTGQPPTGMSMPSMSDGTMGAFNPMTSGFMGPAPMDASSPTAQGFTGPGGSDMSGFMVFNPAQGGWLTEGPTPESAGGLEETVEASGTEAAAADATATTTTTETGSSESTSATTSGTDTTSTDVGE